MKQLDQLQDATIDTIRAILEEIDSIPFVAQENGMGAEEIDSWQGRPERQLRDLVGARRTCILCGAMYLGEHDCF
ncbi:MAG: hypothetical protein DCC55_25685 [Chloroflexi bacterium]|nr:MAG: hypothetical protein DCC55_25685 [Chloroflexota bacterium]